MRIVAKILPFFTTLTAFAADSNRSIFQDSAGNGVANDKLRSGDIHFDQIPKIIVAVTNNVLSLVGYISLAVIMIGALMYIFGGVNEEAKSKGKEAIKLALIGAVISWSAWIVVNFLIDNF
jgi:hypothetical protein